jgi:hypothetical protein
MYSILSGLRVAMNQNEKLLSSQATLKEKNELLGNKDRLFEYFKSQFRDRMSMDAFYISQTYNIDVVLKPWYTLYLSLYGAPYDGVFDAEKMGAVVEQLITEGTITMQEFIDG